MTLDDTAAQQKNPEVWRATRPGGAAPGAHVTGFGRLLVQLVPDEAGEFCVVNIGP